MLRFAVIIFVNLSLFFSWGIFIGPLLNDSIVKQAAGEVLYTTFFSNDLHENYIDKNQFSIDVLHYDINIELFPQKEKISSEVSVKGLIKDKDLTEIVLNFYDNFEINKVELNGKSVEYENENYHLIIPVNGNLINEISNDTFIVKIAYEGKPVLTGLSSFSFDKFKNKPVVYSLNEPVFASTWFPCNDMPDDKALLDIKITSDSQFVSISNGNLISEKSNGKKKTHHWQTVHPISTYLICLYSGDYIKFEDEYTSISGSKLPLTYYVFPEHLEMAKVDFSDHPRMLSFFENTFGEYPFIKEKYGVAEMLWQLGAIEHQTITGIGSNFLNGRKFFNDFYVHELAHQWFGNAVGPKTWKDIWLNEGFATYSEALYAEHSGGFEAYKSVMSQKFQDNFAGTLYDPGDNLFSSTVYDKGAWVLHMLRREIGDSAFFDLLKTYYQNFKYGNASTKDLHKLAEKICGKDLRYFFDQWIYGTGQIKLEYKWKVENDGNNNFKLKINLKQNQEDKIFKFPLDISAFDLNKNEILKETIYIDKAETDLEFNVTNKISKIELDKNVWLLANFFDKNKSEN